MGGGRRLFVYTDYVCPFSYLAWPGVRRLLEEGWPVALQPYQLRPAPAPPLRAEDPELGHDWNTVILPRAERLGLEVRQPAHYPRTAKAHELARHAAREGRVVVMHDRLFRAYFGEGRDIGRIDVLVELAAEVGLERTLAKVELDIDQYADEVRAAQADAHARGVAAVPAYVDEGSAGSRLHMGALEYHELKAWLEQEA